MSSPFKRVPALTSLATGTLLRRERIQSRMAWVAIVRLLAIGFALPVYGRSLPSDFPLDLCDKPAVRREW